MIQPLRCCGFAAGADARAGAGAGSAAATRAWLDRRRVGAVLERRGVEIVDAPPDELPPALADRYLALKAAGRL